MTATVHLCILHASELPHSLFWFQSMLQSIASGGGMSATAAAGGLQHILCTLCRFCIVCRLFAVECSFIFYPHLYTSLMFSFLCVFTLSQRPASGFRH